MRKLEHYSVAFILLLNLKLNFVYGRVVCYEESDIVADTMQSSDDYMYLGDMMLSNKQYDSLFSSSSIKRHGLAQAFKHWPNATVPVKFSDGFNPELKKKAIEAMKYIMDVSCVKFDWKHEPKSDYVLIVGGKRCSSMVGNLRKGAQKMILYEECGKGNMIHEFLHALGFLHMHTAIERDKFVSIEWDNVKEEAKMNFMKYTQHVSMFDTEYDYSSIMHYGDKAFARDKSKPSIKRLKSGSEKMGQRKSMSDGDIIRLNRMYKCPGFETRDDATDDVGYKKSDNIGKSNLSAEIYKNNDDDGDWTDDEDYETNDDQAEIDDEVNGGLNEKENSELMGDDEQQDELW